MSFVHASEELDLSGRLTQGFDLHIESGVRSMDQHDDFQERTYGSKWP
jgi:hypothetical protein